MKNTRTIVWGVLFALFILFLFTKGSGYTERMGVNVSLNTISSMNGAVDVCKQQCDSDASCKGFVYDQAAQRCDFKSDLYSGRENTSSGSVILYSK